MRGPKRPLLGTGQHARSVDKIAAEAHNARMMAPPSILLLLTASCALSACKKGKTPKAIPEPAPSESDPTSPPTDTPSTEEAFPLFEAIALKGPFKSHKDLCAHLQVSESLCSPELGLVLEAPAAPFEAAHAFVRAERSDKETDAAGSCDFAVKVGGEWYSSDDSLDCLSENEPSWQAITMVPQGQANSILTIDYEITWFDTGGHDRTTRRIFCGVGASGKPSCTEGVVVAGELHDRDTQETESATLRASVDTRGVLTTEDPAIEGARQLRFP